MKFENFKDLKKDLLKDPAAQKAYADLELEFSIIDQIIKLRAKNGLSQKDLAERMGTMQPSLARFESGRYNPTVAFLEKLAKALNSKLEIKFK